MNDPKDKNDMTKCFTEWYQNKWQQLKQNNKLWVDYIDSFQITEVINAADVELCCLTRG